MMTPLVVVWCAVVFCRYGAVREQPDDLVDHDAG